MSHHYEEVRELQEYIDDRENHEVNKRAELAHHYDYDSKRQSPVVQRLQTQHPRISTRFLLQPMLSGETGQLSVCLAGQRSI